LIQQGKEELKRKTTTKITITKSDSKQEKSSSGSDRKPSTKRDSSKYPNLSKSLNTKRRRDYLDNLYYVDGIKRAGEEVIRPLNENEKEWLNKFNGEYYGASFDKDDTKNLHTNNVDDVTIYNIRQDISNLRKLAAKENDVDSARELYLELEEQINYLREVYPKKKCQDDNNSRNRCLLNTGKATNQVKFIPWETMDQNLIGDVDIELLYILNDIISEEE